MPRGAGVSAGVLGDGADAFTRAGQCNAGFSAPSPDARALPAPTYK
jgi:hypothetical protein